MEDFVYQKLDRKPPDRVNYAEQLGNTMSEAGNDFGPGTAYGKSSFGVVNYGSYHMLRFLIKVLYQHFSNSFISRTHKSFIFCWRTPEYCKQKIKP